jgi:16S rRNA processing protein RimM
MAPTHQSTSSTELSSIAPMALLEVARIARAHGLRGEVVVALLTNREERLLPGSVLVVGPVHDSTAPVAPAPTKSEAEQMRSLEVRASRPFQNRWLVNFEGVESREDAEALHGAVLMAEPVDDPDALFVHDLIGSELIDQHDVKRGVITAVQANPASDLLVVDGRFYVPVRFVTVSGGGSVRVDIPDGLFDE